MYGGRPLIDKKEAVAEEFRCELPVYHSSYHCCSRVGETMIDRVPIVTVNNHGSLISYFVVQYL